MNPRHNPPPGTDQPISLAAFNALPRDTAVELVQACLPVKRWWATLIDERPYPDAERLLEVARDAAYPLTEAELEAAVDHHLSRRPADWLPHDSGLHIGSPGQQLSPAALIERTNDQLDQYQRRFGRPFIVRTAGHTLREVADQLSTRLSNAADTESANTAVQLRQIALLDLADRIAISR